MQKTVEVPLGLLQDISNSDPCQFDCNGDCQAHLYFGLVHDHAECPQSVLRRIIAEATATPLPAFVEFT